VFQNPANVVERHLRKSGIFVAGKERLALLPQGLVRVSNALPNLAVAS